MKLVVDFEPEGMSDEEREESAQAVSQLLHLTLPYMVSNVRVFEEETGGGPRTAIHSHELVSHMYHVNIPFGLTPSELEFEQTPVRDGMGLIELLEGLAEFKDDELKRVIAGAACLLAKYPHKPAEAALHTAMVWERG